MISGKGAGSPKFGVEGTPISMSTKVSACNVHLRVWCRGTILSVPFHSRCTIKLYIGQTQAGPGYSSALGLGPRTLRWSTLLHTWVVRDRQQVEALYAVPVHRTTVRHETPAECH